MAFLNNSMDHQKNGRGSNQGYSPAYIFRLWSVTADRKLGVVQKDQFLGNTGERITATRTMEFQCSGSDSKRRCASGCSGSLWLNRAQAEERESVRMLLASHQLGRTFIDSLRDPAAQEAAMVQEELQQVEVRAAELAAQREVVAQPRVQVLDQGA